MSAGRPDRGCRGAWGGREALAAADAAGPGGGPSGRETAAKGDADRPAGSGGAGAKGPATASPRLLEALVCPASGGVLEYDSARGELVSRAAHLAYPIRDGVPIMLIDEARKLDP